MILFASGLAPFQQPLLSHTLIFVCMYCYLPLAATNKQTNQAKSKAKAVELECKLVSHRTLMMIIPSISFAFKTSTFFKKRSFSLFPASAVAPNNSAAYSLPFQLVFHQVSLIRRLIPQQPTPPFYIISLIIVV